MKMIQKIKCDYRRIRSLSCVCGNTRLTSLRWALIAAWKDFKKRHIVDWAPDGFDGLGVPKKKVDER